MSRIGEHDEGPGGSAASSADIVVVGAGAAGLMAAIWARRSAPRCRVVTLDSARALGAKILVSGGGRCNVTHETVEPRRFAGSTVPSIAKVLRQFGVEDVIRFFGELGVELKREETGKLFPVSDRAREVLDALLRTARDAGIVLQHPCRVQSVMARAEGFVVAGEWGSLEAARVVLATGGKSVAGTGSDGHGFAIAQALGHTVTPSIFPALVPLLLHDGHWLRTLAGVSTPVRLELRGASGRRLLAVEGPLLCTHFGVSGPAVLDISRHLYAARQHDAAVQLTVSWLPQERSETLRDRLRQGGAETVLGLLRGALPERLLRALCEQAGIEAGVRAAALTRAQRSALVATLLEMTLPVTGDRGFGHAEVTAGGVPLSELKLSTLESRRCAGLHLCGEILDVDGPIGGFNFQWAWSSGVVAGTGAARALAARDSSRAGP